VERFNKVVSLSNKETTYRANDQRRELKFLGTPLSYENYVRRIDDHLDFSHGPDGS